MPFGIDYSFDAPTIEEMKQKAVSFVVRYVSTPGHQKNLIRDILFAGFVSYAWQTRSWSVVPRGDPNGKLTWEPRAQLRQYQHEVVWATGKVDYNTSHAEDFGQWGGQVALTAEDKTWITNLFINTLRVAFAQPWETDTVGAAQNRIQALLEEADAADEAIMVEVKKLGASGIPIKVPEPIRAIIVGTEKTQELGP
jgi:hypothetical protein